MEAIDSNVNGMIVKQGMGCVVSAEDGVNLDGSMEELWAAASQPQQPGSNCELQGSGKREVSAQDTPPRVSVVQIL
jgi:hypothetical protein